MTRSIDPPMPHTLQNSTKPDGISKKPARQPWTNGPIRLGGTVLLVMMLLCLISFGWTMLGSGDLYYDFQHSNSGQLPPPWATFHHPHRGPFWQLLGTTKVGQSLLGRCLAGGVISLLIGFMAAAVSVVLGVTVGTICGYFGGWIDGLLMRIVDILYGLPYVLMVILLKIAMENPLRTQFDKILGFFTTHLKLQHPLMVWSGQAANLTVLFLAIGLVSWLTMARVVRGQVLSLRSMPFVDAARAVGCPTHRIFLRHLLPNLIGPITVYAALTVPSAILQESTLSFLGIGIQAPLPTWGSLASDGLAQALNPVDSHWWLLLFPCTLLAITLLSLNFLGDGLRDKFDPKRRSANV